MDAWLDYLHARGVISSGQCEGLKEMHSHRMPSVSNKAIAFANRMREEHPDLWVGYQAKRRVLGLSSSNPTRK